MKTRIVSIGNSQGIRIPKRLLEQTRLLGEVEISVEANALVIRPINKPRANWATAFQQMAQRGDDTLLDDVAPSLSGWDENEWEWLDQFRAVDRSRLIKKLGKIDAKTAAAVLDVLQEMFET
jgi:antitoxin MazE